MELDALISAGKGRGKGRKAAGKGRGKKKNDAWEKTAKPSAGKKDLPPKTAKASAKQAGDDKKLDMSLDDVVEAEWAERKKGKGRGKTKDKDKDTGKEKGKGKGKGKNNQERGKGGYSGKGQARKAWDTWVPASKKSGYKGGGRGAKGGDGWGSGGGGGKASSKGPRVEWRTQGSKGKARGAGGASWGIWGGAFARAGRKGGSKGGARGGGDDSGKGWKKPAWNLHDDWREPEEEEREDRFRARGAGWGSKGGLYRPGKGGKGARDDDDEGPGARGGKGSTRRPAVREPESWAGRGGARAGRSWADRVDGGGAWRRVEQAAVDESPPPSPARRRAAAVRESVRDRVPDRREAPTRSRWERQKEADRGGRDRDDREPPRRQEAPVRGAPARGAVARREEPPAKRSRREDPGTAPKPKRIKVTNVARDLDEQDLQEAFEAETGRILRCVLDRSTAWITFSRAEDARKAVETFDRGELNGKTITVSMDA